MSEPAFYDPQQIGTLFYPDIGAIAEAARAADLPPASAATQRVHLFVIDMQVDFTHEDGTLTVPGALGDIRRLAEFIFRHAGQITDISCTLDSHLPHQIFHASWWVDEAGRHPDPLTIITADDVEAGRWRPLERADWSRRYVRRLEAEAKKQLVIWPYHVLVGGMGAALDPVLWSAIIWHSLARRSQPAWLWKGLVPQTEHYSAIAPEIPAPGAARGGRHDAVLHSLEEADVVFVAGEAKSHCVLETLEDVVAAFAERPDVLQKMVVLVDCMSSVAHPEVDFDAIADDAFARFAEKGMQFARSTDPFPFLEEEPAASSSAAAEPQPVAGLQRMAEWDEG